MKKVILMMVGVLCSTFAFAQSVIVVDSEKIFKSLPEYNTALTQIDILSKSYQAQVDAKFTEVESAFNSYATMRDSYSATARKEMEARVLKLESEATKFQEEYFSESGILMKNRVELITPIQERVFAAIEAYAKSKGADVVLDRASNPTILYTSSGADHTEAIIATLK